MSWVPAFDPGVWNGWLFMIIYPLQWLAVIVVPKHIAERTSHAAEIFRSRKDKVMAWFTQGLWIAATLYSIFVPFRTGTAWMWVGLAFFVAGLAVLVAATLQVGRTPPGEPFSVGIYRYSRHPMYLSMLLVYMAVSIAAASWLFFLIPLATFFLQRYQAMKEEDYCCRELGQVYREYMAATSRWFGLPARREA